VRGSLAVFKYLLVLPDGQAPNPALLVTAVPTWSIGDVITVSRDEQMRVVGIDDFPHAGLVEQGDRRDLRRRAGGPVGTGPRTTFDPAADRLPQPLPQGAADKTRLRRC